MLTVFVGYEPKQRESYEVCLSSILRFPGSVVAVRPLDRTALEDAGFYERPWTLRDGQYIDGRDGRPFSTEFSFSRFLVPALSLFEGWALYCDCDFLFTADLAHLLRLADPRYALRCVKHTHQPRETRKMDGRAQQSYRRKNWSSLMLWNCAHPRNRCLSGNAVSRMAGSWLHGFEWLADELIGDIPAEWNWLAGVNEPTPKTPKGIHFTLGVPTTPGHEDTAYADLWRAERDSLRAIRPASKEFAA